MTAFVPDRHQAANTQPGHAGFHAPHRRLAAVGLDDGLADRGEVVAELGRLVHPQEGCRRRLVELELTQAVVLRQLLVAGHEQLGEALPVVPGHRLPNLGNARHQRREALGGEAFRGDCGADVIGDAAQLAALGIGQKILEAAEEQRSEDGDGHDQQQHEADRDALTDADIGEHARGLPAADLPSSIVGGRKGQGKQAMVLYRPSADGL